jgi:hypothetical protein
MVLDAVHLALEEEEPGELIMTNCLRKFGNKF